ncbi:MAG: hypothetical protein PHP46_04605 [Candidatus Omnitrophica bacterium]|nr:hypothetical protein [Candidatus Omnitrophota bacterium]
MMEPTIVTWILGISGVLLYLPAIYIQAFAVFRPHDQRTKDMLVGKGGDYHDKTYFDFCRGSGWADLGIQIPLVMIGSIAVLFGHPWAYTIWAAGAFITIYIHLILLFMEGKHIYDKWGPIAFFTYGWGLWVYWAIIVVIYSLLRIGKL